jgi:hypothetical protein
MLRLSALCVLRGEKSFRPKHNMRLPLKVIPQTRNIGWLYAVPDFALDEPFGFEDELTQILEVYVSDEPEINHAAVLAFGIIANHNGLF